MPNMIIIAPKNIKELVEAMKFAETYDGPVAIRFARGVAYTGAEGSNEEFNCGKSEIIKSGKKVALIAVGNMVEETEKAVELLKKDNIFPTFINARFVKPVDYEMVAKTAREHDVVIVVEEGIKRGGYGENIEAYIAENNYNIKVAVMAIDDMFVKQGSVEALRKRIGISYKDIYEKVLELTK